MTNNLKNMNVFRPNKKFDLLIFILESPYQNKYDKFYNKNPFCYELELRKLPKIEDFKIEN